MAVSLVNAARGELLVEVRAEAVDGLGQPIDSVVVGTDFRVRIYVRDLRDATEIKSFEGDDLFGVFSAFVSTQFDTARVSAIGTPTVDPFYPLFLEASSAEDHVSGGGASISFYPAKEQLLYSAPFHAQAPGWATFSLLPQVADPNEWLLYGSNGPPLGLAEIATVDLELAIVPEPGSWALAAIGLALLWGWRIRPGRR